MNVHFVKTKRGVTFLILLLSFACFGQKRADKDSINIKGPTNIRFQYKSLIVPSVLIGYGLLATESHTLIDFNGEIKEEVNEHIDEKFTMDDISQYAPALAVYGLNMADIKGRNTLRDRTVILGTAYLIMGSSVTGLKAITRVERPDGTSRNSFPSGHTATAFMGAEFLYQEYKDVSVWYGMAGYAVAVGTGFFRIYNDRHWFSDVVAGAGIGILSTKIAYWVHPFINKKLFPNHVKEPKYEKAFASFYNGREAGVGAVIRF
ncbi:phosphatase PAP2 family protein [Galbibacter pacificus]|uniref:Phosphatase PAP2 family protein n=1 Tax=Galbibacter pacificus TaxID=2996052 RepID=A0ABT6FWH9_9FLAO|nr:phosphatase PAP2 family protein [Galbibacter pacificus]MDG3583938.1 phosphatase PAP2 family protein [Galbibacter pacificus]MDG3587624.1 phosphatase PAP2 family protein [Galbibacter pacificus]